MVELKKNVTRACGRGIPGISFENEETKLGIANLYSNKNDIYEYLALILLRFDFEPEDMIFICNYDKENNSFDCIRNDEFVCRLCIDKNNSEIIISKYNVEYVYKCINEERSELGMIIMFDRYVYMSQDGIVYTRYFSRDFAKFLVEDSGYRLEFMVDRPIDIKLRLFDEDGKYAKYKLDNEKHIMEYLMEYAIYQDIINVYKNLSVHYLGNVSKYPNFYLRKYKIGRKEKLVDLVYLKYGKLEKFGMTDFGMSIFLDKDNNWTYEVSKDNSVPVDFCISSYDGRINCCFSFNEADTNIKKYINDEFDSEIDIAMDEVRGVKKLVRTMFD